MSKNKKNKENLDKEIFPTQQEETKEGKVEQTEVEEKEHSNLEKLEDCSCEGDCCCEKKENEEEILALNNQINALKEALLRNQAELQNYKRRKDEETERTMKYKNEEIIKELLSVVDNFERAIKMDDNDLSDEVSKFLAGFKLIYTNTINILNKFEVQEINAEGIEFDPNYHHAVLTEHDETKPAGVILEVLQKGYTYKDRVIRPAMVKVNE